eukprot:Skav205416  [mRNA]  locus=scaffold582:123310:125493:- [translate_table: standard]
MQFTAKQTNAGIMMKLHALEQLWPALAQSQAPLSHKQRVLTTVAWPRAFYAASTVHLSDQEVNLLRRGAMKSLLLDKQGSNPSVQLSLTGDALQDPGYFLLWDAIAQARRHSDPDMFATHMDTAAWMPDRQKKPGPAGVLTTRLSKIGWQYASGSCFVDHEGQWIDILRAPVQEVKQRTKRGWCQAIGHQVSARPEFAGMHKVDVMISNKPVADFVQEEVGLMRALKNGTAITNNHLHASGIANTKQCRFCSSDDSLMHRHWECEATQHLRDMLPSDVQANISQLPACTLTRGWFQEGESQQAFKASLASIPCTVHDHDVPAFAMSNTTLDLFTDGTGLDPASPNVRLVAWSVVASDGSVFPSQSTHVVAQGGVPGQWQSVLRAELTAMLSALSFASKCGKSCRVWCDNALVVDRCHIIQRDALYLTNMSPGHDLWELLVEAIRTFPADLEVIKVASHQDVTTANDLELWAFQGNEAADRAARRAITGLPGAVVRLQSAAAAESKWRVYLQQHLHKHFARVGMFAIHQGQDPTMEPVEHVPTKLQESDIVVDFREVARAAEECDQRLLFSGFRKLLTWLNHISASDGGEVQWVTWYELLFSLQLGTGIRSIRKESPQGRWIQTDPHSDYAILQECHSFSAYLTALIRLVHAEWKPSHVKPSFYKFQKWGMCIAMRWNPDDAQSTHTWMHSMLGDQPITNLTKAMGALPCAASDAALPVCGGLHRCFR